MAAVVTAFVPAAGDEFRVRPVLNRRGRKVGEIRVTSGLIEAIREGRKF